MDPVKSSSMPRVPCRNSVNSEIENLDMEIIYIYSLQYNITFLVYSPELGFVFLVVYMLGLQTG